MGAGSQSLREQLVAILDIARRRWPLFVIPVLLASLLSWIAVQIAPTKYTASSLIMLQAANRAPTGSPGGVYSNAVEQVQAVEAWLKSDQILAELAPRMAGYKPPQSPVAAMVQLRLLAASLSLEMVGNSVLQIGMVSDKPEGLGRNLEIVLSRLMEGLTGPEQSIFSAPQFLAMRRKEEVANAEAALMRAIEVHGAEAPQQVRSNLHRIWTATAQKSDFTARARSNPRPLTDSILSAELLERLRPAIAKDPAEVAELEKLYATYQAAVERLEAAEDPSQMSRNNYVSIFSSPQDLLIIGRPKDPISGESAVRRIAIAGVLFSTVLGAGLIFLAELMGGVLRTRRDFQAVTPLPVLARVPRLAPPTAPLRPSRSERRWAFT